MSPCSKVRARKSHKAELASVCAATDRKHKRCNTRIFTGFLCILNQMHASGNNLSHILVLVSNRKLHSAFSPFFIEVLLNMAKSFFSGFKQILVMISYNIMKLCFCHISTHTGQMVESFIILRFTRDFKSWKHVIDFSGNQARIDHRILAGTRMHSKAGNFKICLACIEVFILNFSFGIAIQSVGKLCSKFFYVKMISSTTDFFIWCKSD